MYWRAGLLAAECPVQVTAMSPDHVTSMPTGFEHITILTTMPIASAPAASHDCRQVALKRTPPPPLVQHKLPLARFLARIHAHCRGQVPQRVKHRSGPAPVHCGTVALSTRYRNVLARRCNRLSTGNTFDDDDPGLPSTRPPCTNNIHTRGTGHLVKHRRSIQTPRRDHLQPYRTGQPIREILKRPSFRSADQHGVQPRHLSGL